MLQHIICYFADVDHDVPRKECKFSSPLVYIRLNYQLLRENFPSVGILSKCCLPSKYKFYYI